MITSTFPDLEIKKTNWCIDLVIEPESPAHIEYVIQYYLEPLWFFQAFDYLNIILRNKMYLLVLFTWVLDIDCIEIFGSWWGHFFLAYFDISTNKFYNILQLHAWTDFRFFITKYFKNSFLCMIYIARNLEILKKLPHLTLRLTCDCMTSTRLKGMY